MHLLFFLKRSTLRDAKISSCSISTTLTIRKVRKMEIILPYCVTLRKLFKHCLTFHSIGKIKWEFYWKFFEHLGPEELQKAKVKLFSYPLFLLPLPLILASLKRKKLAITFCLITLHVVETVILKQFFKKG